MDWLIRTGSDLYRYSAANAHGRDMHEAVDILAAAIPTKPTRPRYNSVDVDELIADSGKPTVDVHACSRSSTAPGFPNSTVLVGPGRPVPTHLDVGREGFVGIAGRLGVLRSPRLLVQESNELLLSAMHAHEPRGQTNLSEEIGNGL